MIFWKCSPILVQHNKGVGGCQKLSSRKALQEHHSSPQVVVRPQWAPPWSGVQSQADNIHLMCSTGAILSVPHLHSAKSYLEKSRAVKYGDWIHSVMIAIECSFKLGRKIIA